MSVVGGIVVMSGLMRRERTSMKENEDEVKERIVLDSEHSCLACLCLSKGKQQV